jgi:hypothetical protein
MCLYYCQEQNENKQRTFRENNLKETFEISQPEALKSLQPLA